MQRPSDLGDVAADADVRAHRGFHPMVRAAELLEGSGGATQMTAVRKMWETTTSMPARPQSEVDQDCVPHGQEVIKK